MKPDQEINMAETNIERHMIRLSEAKKYINHVAVRRKRPVFLWGAPGVGKSDVIESIVKDAIAAGKDAKLYDMRLSMCEPTDIMGIPYFDSGANIDAKVMTKMFQEQMKSLDRNDVNAIATAQAEFAAKVEAVFGQAGGTMKWAPPSLLPKLEDAGRDLVVLFLDEMNGAAPAVQAAAYQLVLNRRVGEYMLPDNVAVVAAGNRDTDKGVTYRMPKPLSNRFVHFEVRVDFGDWVEWATNNGVSADVVGYLTVKKNDLNRFDPKSPDHAFPTPRSWVFVSDILQDSEGFTDGEITDMIIGTIGQGTALSFAAHRKISSLLPDPTLILKGQITELKTKEISAMYSLATSLAYELKAQKNLIGREIDEDTMQEYINNTLGFWMAHFEPEMIVASFRMLIKYGIKPDMQRLSNWKAFLKRYGDLVRAA
jgi:MoxR-like ATPase